MAPEKTLLIPKKYTVLNRVEESPDTFTITVDMQKHHEPGQFFQVSLPGIGECPISVCSYSKKHVTLNIRKVGNMTQALAKLKEGYSIFIRGPYGHGYPMKDLVGNSLILVGGGCGVAPLKGVIDYVVQHRDQYKDVHVFLGYRSPNDILFKRDLKAWQEQFHVTVTVDKEPKGEFCYDGKVGFVTDAIKEAQLSNEGCVVCMCGPPVMMKFAVSIFQNKGFNDDQLFISAERLMFCGKGSCCHCMIRGKYTCVDGPVFRYDTIKGFDND